MAVMAMALWVGENVYRENEGKRWNKEENTGNANGFVGGITWYNGIAFFQSRLRQRPLCLDFERLGMLIPI
jgi:hypothetical protein